VLNLFIKIIKIIKLKDMGNNHAAAAATVTGVSLAVVLYSTYSSENKPAANPD